MKRTHQARILRPGDADDDAYAPGEPGWAPVGSTIEATLQPLTGSVEQSAAGREVRANWKGFVPAGTDVQEDDGVVVTAGVGPQRYRVRQVGARGGRWDTELLLESTEELFEEAP